MKPFIIALACLLAAPVSAQKRWTLEECIRQAIANNIDLKQARLTQDARRIDLSTSKNSWLPTLNAGLGQDFDFSRSPSNNGLIVDYNSASSSAGLQLDMPLFDGFKTSNDIAAKKLDLRAAVESLRKAQDDLAVNVASYYLQVLYEKEILRIAELAKALTRQQVEKTQLLVDNGKAPRSQLYDIKAQLAKDEVTRTDADNDLRLALLNLAQLLELERDSSDFDIATPDLSAYHPEADDGLPSPQLVYEQAVGIKPVILEQEYLLDSRKKAVKVARAAYFPQLSLSMSYTNYYYHYSGSDVQNISFADQIKQNERKTIGFTLSIPIFNRFATRNGVRQARVAVFTQELALENARKSLYKEIQQAWLNAVSSQKKYISATRSVASSEEAYKYAEERYATGKSDVFDYGEAKNKYAQSLADQAQAKYDYLFRKKILEFYQGIPFSL
ncbi:MAG: TolC family protein [Tannerella sp.]|jgi:outer membrane protein|nr:TolC family protein [Tannerella sp.]